MKAPKKYQSKAHQEVSEKKMKQVAEWLKSPMSREELDKQIQEQFEDHGQINPNKKRINLQYLNDFHKENVLLKMKEKEEWKKLQLNLEQVLKEQREKEKIAREMEKKYYPSRIKET